MEFFCGVADLTLDSDGEGEPRRAAPLRPLNRPKHTKKRVVRRAPFARRLRGEHRAASMTLVETTSLSAEAATRARDGDPRALRVAARLCDDAAVAAQLYAALAACEAKTNPGRALAACDEGLAMCGDHDTLANVKASALAQLGRYDDAVAVCRDDYTKGLCYLGACDHGAAYRAFAHGFLRAKDDKLTAAVDKRVKYYPSEAADLDTAARRLVAAKTVPVHVAPLRRTTGRLVAVEECAELVRMAQASVWTTTRHDAYPTRDVAVIGLGTDGLCLVNRWLKDALLPVVEAHFGHPGTWRVQDAFVVKYTQGDSLPVHQDQALVSLTVGLNSLHDYDGGGLRFFSDDEDGVDVACDVASAVVFASSLRHAANEVTRGTRFILAVFLYSVGVHLQRVLS